MENSLACQLRKFLLHHEISQELAFTLLASPAAHHKQDKYKPLLNRLYQKPESISRFNKELRFIAEQAHHCLGFELPPGQGASLFSLILFGLSSLLAIILAPIAIGGLLYLILAGASNLSITYGVPALAVLAICLALMVLLAALEGSQISIVSLRTKDLSGIARALPRCADIQQLTKKTSESQKYLAGRQFFVIFVVFLIAQSTSFPNAADFMPESAATIINAVPLLDLALLKLGFLGAFVTLWFGQLAPQFYANKNPQAMLDVFGMKAVVQLCFLFESFGFARPGSWLITHLKPGAPIATSQREEFENIARDNGYQTLLQEYHWQLESAESWQLHYQRVTGFTSNGIAQIKEDGLEVYGNSLLPEFINMLHPENRQRAVISEGAESIRLGDEWHTYLQVIKPSHGSFANDETISSRINIEGNEKLTQARLSITRPTKLIHMKWEAYAAVLYLSPITIRKYKYDDTIELLRLVSEQTIDIHQQNSDGESRRAEYIETFPKIGTYYEFSWEYA